jgi:hypothetical protein
LRKNLVDIYDGEDYLFIILPEMASGKGNGTSRILHYKEYSK